MIFMIAITTTTTTTTAITDTRLREGVESTFRHEKNNAFRNRSCTVTVASLHQHLESSQTCIWMRSDWNQIYDSQKDFKIRAYGPIDYFCRTTGSLKTRARWSLNKTCWDAMMFASMFSLFVRLPVCFVFLFACESCGVLACLFGCLFLRLLVSLLQLFVRVLARVLFSCLFVFRVCLYLFVP